MSLDAAYPLLSQLLTPYITSRGRLLTAGQKRYNKLHSSTRQKIGNAFSDLVRKWRFLYKHLYLKDVNRCCKAIVTCCVLHNLCIDDGENLQCNHDGILYAFQLSDNRDGVQFQMTQHHENHLSERDMSAHLRRLKHNGERRRLDVQNIN